MCFIIYLLNENTSIRWCILQWWNQREISILADYWYWCWLLCFVHLQMNKIKQEIPREWSITLHIHTAYCMKMSFQYSSTYLMPEPSVWDLRSSSVSQHVVLHALHTGVLSHFRAICRLILLHLCEHKHRPWISYWLQINTKYQLQKVCFLHVILSIPSCFCHCLASIWQ